MRNILPIRLARTIALTLLLCTIIIPTKRVTSYRESQLPEAYPTSMTAYSFFGDPVNITNNAGITVDTQPSIAVDHNGYVHIAYMGTYVKTGAPDNVTTDIFYTHNIEGMFSSPLTITVPTDWYSHEPTLAVDSTGAVHIVFRRSEDQIFVSSEDDLYYANNRTGTFNVIRLIDGYWNELSMHGSPIICIDKNDTVHVAMIAETGEDLFDQIYYFNNSGGTFGTPVRVTNGIDLVYDYMMALDNNGWPHFAFFGIAEFGEDDAQAYYVKAITDPFNAPTFSTPVNVSNCPRSISNFFPGLVVDTQGNAHIVFRDPYGDVGAPDLVYVTNRGGSFSTPVGISADYMAWAPSIDIDKDGYIHVVHRISGGLGYANNIGGVFPLENSQDIGAPVVHSGTRYFAIGPDYSLHIVYYSTLSGMEETDIYYVRGNIYQKPVAMSIAGSTTGVTHVTYPFTATVTPITATVPITYVWQASEQSTVIDTSTRTTHSTDFSWTTAGDKTITVTAMNAGGAITATHHIAIQPCYALITAATPSTAGYVTTTPAPNCGGQYLQNTHVTLTAVASQGYAFDHWSGDATGMTNPITVIMTANKTITATFYAPVHASFSATPTSGPIPLDVTFTNTSRGDYTTSLWDFGDGLTSTLDNPTHTYTAARTYTVTLTINGPGGTDVISHAHYITGYRPVQAAFTAAPTFGFTPLAVTFTNISSGDYTTSLWEFGDGLTSTLANPSHVYTTAGTRTLTLTVNGPGGTHTSVRTNYITVYEGVKAAFTATPVSGALPLIVTFTDSSSGPVAAWQWDFGDSTMSDRQHPTHTYTQTGVYTVALTVQVAGASALLPGGTDTISRARAITVTEAPPQVAFTGSPRSGEAPLTVQFTSAVTGTVTDYRWNFGDDGVASTPNPTHTYHSAGSFGVVLEVTGPGGAAKVSKPDYITINAPPGVPTANFSADVVSGVAPLTVTFTAVTSGTVEGWQWQFGDGGNAVTGPVIQHTYVTSGTFDVSLLVSNTHGNYTASKPDYISVWTSGESEVNIYLPLILRSST